MKDKTIMNDNEPKSGAETRPFEALVRCTPLIEAYDDYIELLQKELDNLAGLAHSHGWKSDRIESGKRARRRIKKLKEPRLSDLVDYEDAEEILRNNMPNKFVWEVNNKESWTIPIWLIKSMYEYASKYTGLSDSNPDIREMVAQAWIDGNREGWEMNTDWPEAGYKYYDDKYT